MNAVDALQLIVGGLAGCLMGWSVARLRVRSARVKAVPPHVEYRVFLPSGDLETDRLLREMRDLPGLRPMTHSEALVASDVRLHLGVVRREKNQSAFRPDLLADADGASEVAVARFMEAGLFVRVRWVSETPADSSAARVFCARAAASLAARSERSLVYNAISERLTLGEAFDARADEGVRVQWSEVPGGGSARTYGLPSFGRADLFAATVPGDHRSLTESVLADAALLYADGQPDAAVTVEAYGDQFTVSPVEMKGGLVSVRFFRVART